MTKTKPMTDEWKEEIGSILDELIDSQKDFRNQTPLGKQTSVLIAHKKAVVLIDSILTQATSKAREEALDDMFLEIAKLAVPDERQPSAGDLHINMDDIHEIRKSLKRDK